MRIGIDARLRAYRRGGIAEHTARLVEGLVALGEGRDLVVLDHRKSGADRPPAWAELTVRRLWTPPHHRWEGWALPVEIAGLGLDVLHSPDVVPPRGWRGASVATVHDVAFLRQPERLTPDSLRYYAGDGDPDRVRARVAAGTGRPTSPGSHGPAPLEWDRGIYFTRHRAERIIVVSDHTRRELVALTGADPERVRVIPNAVHPRFAAPGDPTGDAATLARHGLSEPYVLFVSTIEPRKNVATLLEAYRRLVDSGTGAALALAGADGWHSDDVHMHVRRLALDRRARFLGFVPEGDLPALYRRAAVLAHPAHDEGFGFTPAEAMAAGVPVVVADAGSLPEIVGDAGLRVPATDADAWAGALRRVLDDPTLAAALRDAGRAQAAAFTLERQARATLAVYHEAYDAHRARRRSERARAGSPAARRDGPRPGRAA